MGEAVSARMSCRDSSTPMKDGHCSVVSFRRLRAGLLFKLDPMTQDSKALEECRRHQGEVMQRPTWLVREGVRTR